VSASYPAVPLLDLQAQYAPLREEVLAAITRVCDSQRFIMGPEITSLERELATLIGVEHTVAAARTDGARYRSRR
jgi:dTDP-4-amino-4,6-dideoxygalactose transaminase